MEDQRSKFIDIAANMVEQMRNQALGLQSTTPGRQEPEANSALLLPPLQNMILDTIEHYIHLGTTLEPLQHLGSPSAGPDSSGDEDARGYKRRTRINSREKKELMLLAANICHTEFSFDECGRALRSIHGISRVDFFRSNSSDEPEQ